jgi:tRNA-splicing ligase RtcB
MKVINNIPQPSLTVNNFAVPVKLWTDNVEESAMGQIENLARYPFAFHHIAIMPDVHMGYGMPIGGVLATKDVVIPNAVGVDIGCGMCAVKTALQEISTEDLKKIMSKIREFVPVGFKHQEKEQDVTLMPLSQLEKDGWDGDFDAYPIIQEQYDNALTQIGTLGSGNHFIEIQKGSDGYIWIMIHSGSRNLGKQVADHYNKLAIELNSKWYSIVPKEWQLAFLPLDDEDGQSYLREMNYCVEFAYANRKLMMERILGIFESVLGLGYFDTNNTIINIAHNYATLEKHFGQNVLVHRKGATLARQDTVGIIPGSQGSKSYIVQGLGNADSFNSCSHGAGRKMSRTRAQNELSLEDEIKLLDDQGIIHGIRNKNDLDEAAGAYKNIDEVMENQKDLVKILVELKPLAVIKG